MKRFAGLLLAISLAAGLLTGISAVTPLTEPAAAASYVSKKYTSPKKGQSNSSVKALQRRLVAAKILNRKWVNGHFTTKTENGVKRFQKKYDRKADGKVTRSVSICWSGRPARSRSPRRSRRPRSPSGAGPEPACCASTRPGASCTTSRSPRSSRPWTPASAAPVRGPGRARCACSARTGTGPRPSTTRRCRIDVLQRRPGRALLIGLQGPRLRRLQSGCVNIRAKSAIRYVFKHIRRGDKAVVYRN